MKTAEKIKDKVREDYIIPAVDIYENDNEYVLKAEMPGVSKENVEISLEKDYLEILGKTDTKFEEGLKLIDKEFRISDYFRRFHLENVIDREKVKASIENGILTVVLPKSEEVKPKKITITTE